MVDYGLTPKELKKLKADIKRANQRITELEKNGLSNSSQAYGRLSKISESHKPYIEAIRKKQTGAYGFKFTTGLATAIAKGELTTSDIKALKSDVESFLGDLTSTKTGIEHKKKKLKNELIKTPTFQKKLKQAETDEDFRKIEAELDEKAEKLTTKLTHGSYVYDELKRHGLESLCKTEAWKNASGDDVDALIINIDKFATVIEAEEYLKNIHTDTGEKQKKRKAKTRAYDIE